MSSDTIPAGMIVTPISAQFSSGNLANCLAPELLSFTDLNFDGHAGYELAPTDSTQSPTPSPASFEVKSTPQQLMLLSSPCNDGSGEIQPVVSFTITFTVVPAAATFF